ncbi:MAG: thiamine pyrophosphate-binding protein [Rhizobiaceae bacterium]|nr:thiamine pyrophosphate-binding protein [Rhizobiaceae bacterium]
MKTGGAHVVEGLVAHGVKRLFCVPGESYLAVLDALVGSGIEVVTCRQEGGAAMMADAHAKLTGETGVCFVTRGPGATNASAGIHVASQDSTPLVLFIGQVATAHLGREAFQEIDYQAFFGSVAKAVFQPVRAADIPQAVADAFRIAQSGRMGPVVVALPEDILTEEAEASAIRLEPEKPAPSLTDLIVLASMLRDAQRPIAILGGSGWDADAVHRFTRFAEAWALPVAVSFRRQMLFDHLHPNYAGDVGIGINPNLRKRIDEADLILLVGGRLGEMPSQGYELLDIPRPKQKLVHVHPGVNEIGKVYEADLGIVSTPAHFAMTLETLYPSAQPNGERAAQAHADYLAWSTPPERQPGALSMSAVMNWLEANLPPDAIMTNGAGNYATWLHRFHRFRMFATQAAPTSGSMGYGLPAAVAAALALPGRQVVCFAGDGCFLMHGQEFSTAMRHNLPIVVLVINNGMYGTIRMHQERDYPGRVSATDLTNPDFASLARAYGGHGETVECTEDFPMAWLRAANSGLPAIIELRIDPEAITPSRTLSQIRAGT